MVARPWTLHGPFHLDKHSEYPWKSLFREQAERYAGLIDAAGVYIIGSTNRSKDRIHYVGMTHDQGFRDEIFSQRNLGLVWDPIVEMRNRCVKVWLIAKRNASGRGYCWDARLKGQAHLLESLFIMHAKAAGHSLINTSKMKLADGIAVEGLFGSFKRGKPRAGLIELAEALGIY